MLTNVALEHTEVLGSTREAIAREKLAVVQPGATVVLGEPEWEAAGARRTAPPRVVVATGGNLALAGPRRRRSSAARPRSRGARCGSPGRLERGARRRTRSGTARTTPAGRRLLAAAAAAPAGYVVVASILADKDVDGDARARSRGSAIRLVATASSNPRALPAAELAARGAPALSRTVEADADPARAARRARELAGEPGPCS